MMKKLIAALLVFMPSLVAAQDSQAILNFLRLPGSAHVAALGGDNISIQEDDGLLAFHNPALLNGVSDRTLSLGMMNYMQGSTSGVAAFAHAAGDRGTWGVQGRFISYGEMKEMTEAGEQTGTFSARDVALGGSFAYALTNTISGGITARVVGSYLGSYSSMAAAVDLGLNYYDEEREWSISAVARNLGGQLTAYEDDFERMPLDLQVGVTKRLIGAPLRFSATLTRLSEWHYGIGHHLIVGADLLLSEQLYLSAGYNALRAKEMKITSGDEESSHGAALSFGGGLQLQRLKLHVAYAKYHVSSAALVVNISYAL